MRPQYTRNCLFCGKQFHPPPSKVKGGGGKFCSRPCVWADAERNVAERFWVKTAETPTCLLWTAGTFDDGYGMFKRKGHDGVFRLQRAHRVAYQLANDCCVLPGFEVLHSCDNPLCVRPAHLFLGTTLDNRQDCCDKGRQARGETSGRAKLTAADVVALRERYANGARVAHLAREFGMARSAMAAVVKYTSWQHIE